MHIVLVPRTTNLKDKTHRSLAWRNEWFLEIIFYYLYIFSIDDGFVCVTLIGDDVDDDHVSCF